MNEANDNITINIFVRNGASTLGYLFSSLESQTYANLVKVIRFFYDKSKDNSLELIHKYSATSKYPIEILEGFESLGLAGKMNKAMRMCTTRFCMFMHQDIQFLTNDIYIEYLKVLEPDIFISYPIYLNPITVYKKYNIWGKCLFSRTVGKKLPTINGKLDCVNIDMQRERGLYFDEFTYLTGGEDVDMLIRLARLELKTVCSKVQVTHLHDVSSKFSLGDLIFKERQFSEIYGVLLRKHGIYSIKYVFSIYARFVPVIVIPFSLQLTLVTLLLYCVLYSKNVFRHESKRNLVLYLLPFINLYLLINFYIYFILGFLKGRQRERRS